MGRMKGYGTADKYASLYAIYAKIADNSYKEDHEYMQQLLSLDYIVNVDYIGDGDFDDYLGSSGRSITNEFTAILFEALAVESLINYYATHFLGQSFFKDHIDKLSTISKYIVATKLVTGKDFPKSTEIYQRLDLLISTRNLIAHSKAVKVNLENWDEARVQLLKLFTYDDLTLDEIMEKTHGLCKDLYNLLDSLTV